MEISKQPIFFKEASRFICIFYLQEKPSRVNRNRKQLTVILPQDVGIPSTPLIHPPMLLEFALIKEVSPSARKPYTLVVVTFTSREISDVIPLDGARNCQPDDDWPP
jgi:hypothetical protein